MSFGSILPTTKGRNLRAKAIAGTVLNFTRLAVGDGTLGSAAIEDLTTLIHEIKSISITELKTLTGGKATLKGVLSNQDLATGFYWKELGLYATDPDLGEILYCYGNAGDLAEYIPSPGGSEILEKQIGITTIIGTATNVSATIEQSLIYASTQDLLDHENNSFIHVTSDEKNAWNEKETTTGSQEKVDALAGEGNTKTVKEIAEAIETHSAEDATTAKKGHVQLATNAEVTTGTNTTKAITPSGAKVELDKKINNTDYVRAGGYAVTSGTATAYTITLNTAPTSYADGQQFIINPHVDCGINPTLNVNGLGVGTILKQDGSAVLAGEIKANKPLSVVRVGSSFFIRSAGGGSNIKSIQKGITSLIDYAIDVNVPINNIDVNNSVVYFSIRTKNTTLNTTFVKAKLTSGTNINFAAGTSGQNIEISWHVIEFKGLKSFQKGETTFTSNTLAGNESLIVNINSIDLTKSILIFNYSYAYNHTDISKAFLEGYLNSANDIKFLTKTSASSDSVSYNIQWYVVEF